MPHSYNLMYDKQFYAEIQKNSVLPVEGKQVFWSAFGILHIFSELGPSDTLQAWTAFA